MNFPLVTVVVATYRRKETLYNALVSLCQQTYSNLEIIVVDDNSEKSWNESVLNIIFSVRKNYPNINIHLEVNKENKGSAKSRNIGIEMAAGEYITFLDDDDIYLPDKIKNQLNSMIKSKADYGITDLYLYNKREKLVNKRIRWYLKKDSPKELFEYHLKYHLTGTDTFMFKREYLISISGFEEIDVGDEYFLMSKAIQNNGKFNYLNVCDIKAYIHTGEGGLSSGQKKIDGENELYNYKKAFFDVLDTETIRYIRMRHYAVIAFAELRRKKIISFIKNMFVSMFCAPIACINMFLFER